MWIWLCEHASELRVCMHWCGEAELAGCPEWMGPVLSECVSVCSAVHIGVNRLWCARGRGTRICAFIRVSNIAQLQTAVLLRARYCTHSSPIGKLKLTRGWALFASASNKLRAWSVLRDLLQFSASADKACTLCNDKFDVLHCSSGADVCSCAFASCQINDPDHAISSKPLSLVGHVQQTDAITHVT